MGTVIVTFPRHPARENQPHRFEPDKITVESTHESIGITLSQTAALNVLRQAVRADPDNWIKHQNLGMLQCLYGDLQAGFCELEWRQNPTPRRRSRTARVPVGGGS